MELHHLRTFVAVAEEGHLTRASERLHTSQPAISAQIKALEEELGIALFHRTPRGMQLTPEGEQVLPRARQTLAAAGEVLQHAKTLQDELVGTVRIGLNTDADFLQLTQLHALLAERYPKLEVHLLTGMSHLNLRDIRTGKLDAGFVFGTQNDQQIEMVALHDTRLRIAAPTAWRERLTNATLDDIVHMPWIYTSTDCSYYAISKAVLEDHQCCQPPKAIVSDNEEALRSLVKAGAGLAIMREDEVLQAEREGYAFPLDMELPPITLHLAYKKGRGNETLIYSVLEILAEIWGVELSTATTASKGKTSKSTRPVL
ncbi:MAG: LysR family transcriptional regulator [Chromatiales bacterium]|nr:LysR family transcriptional regulator [Chromatiales bacterium]